MFSMIRSSLLLSRGARRSCGVCRATLQPSRALSLSPSTLLCCAILLVSAMAFAARSFIPFSAAAGASSSSSLPLIRRLAVLPAAASGLGSWSQQSSCRRLPSPPYKIPLCHSVWEFDHGRLHYVFPVAGLYRTSWSGSEQQLRRLSSAAADREFDWEVRSSSRWTQQRLERKERCRVENVRCMCYASTPPRNQVSFDVPVIVHESTTVDISLQV